jgi:two-component system cell cycle sensor histidine kinase/response regulator CckA
MPHLVIPASSSGPLRARDRYSRSAQLGGLAVAAIGALALAGWATGSAFLKAGSPSFIPMAPNTGLLFVALGLVVFALSVGSAAGLRFARIAAAGALVVSGARLAEYLVGVDLRVDRWLFSVPSVSLGLAPVGRMAFFTALAFVFAASAALIRTTEHRRRVTDDLARASVIISTLIGLVFLIGYGYGSPLLYGGRAIPMALPTAAAFVLLGLSLVVPDALRDAAAERQAARALRVAHDQRTAELGAAVRSMTQAEQALHREREFLAAALESLTDGVLACDAQGILTVANRAARELCGLPEGPLPGERWAGHYALYAADGKMLLRQEQQPLFRALAGETVESVEVVVAPKAGQRRTILKSGRPIYDASGNNLGAVVALHDVTEERSLEEQFRQAQKMEAVGQLAGGVAHDFNNLLTVISSYSEMLLDARPANDSDRADLEEIKHAASRAAGLTRQLLAFSRKQVMQPRVLDLNSEVIGGLEKMLRRLIGEDIELMTTLDKDLDLVRADPGQLEQVIVNLAVNARDAMPNGGRLVIETANAELGNEDAGRHFGAKPGHYVMLAVSDTGTGMSRETMSRMFEPFFTTKEQGKGTGLGLATVHGIVKQSGGDIWVYSEPGEGTTFKVYLPRVDETVAEAMVVSPKRYEHGGGETILLVEDEDALRSLARKILVSRGYTVLEARHGQEALSLCEGPEPAIDIVLTDAVMPGMSGRALAERLAALRPSARVLLMSGYTDDDMLRRGILDPRMAFLQKPFTPTALAQKVRETLDGPGAVAIPSLPIPPSPSRAST